MDWDGLIDFQGAQSQKESQEDQWTIKQLGGYPLSSCTFPWFSWPSFWLRVQEAVQMVRSYPSEITYSPIYPDGTYDYRHVTLTQHASKEAWELTHHGKRLLTDPQWRSLGVVHSRRRIEVVWHSSACMCGHRLCMSCVVSWAMLASGG